MQNEKEHILYRFGADGNLRLYSYDRLFYSLYGYDGGTTRTYKYSFDLTPNWVNGRLEAVNFNPHTAMFYPNAYINFNNNGYYTKHYYNGMERIASRLGDQNLPINVNDPDLQDRKDQLDSNIRRNIVGITGYEFLPVGEEQTIDDPKPVFELPQVGITGLQPSADGIYYYHPNHLGSTCYVTDENASVVQGFLYAPFGEITNEHNSSFGNGVIPKYSFNAKELDEETGMYYYEARYYQPPAFISRDRLFEKYPFMTPYGYCMNNPIKYIDPSGDSIAILLAGRSVCRLGHMAILIQNEKKEWFLWSKNAEGKQIFGKDIGAENEKPGLDENGNPMPFKSVQMFLNSDYNTYNKDGVGESKYTEAYVIPTTQEQDEEISNGMKLKLDENYSLFTNNCSEAVYYALAQVGLVNSSYDCSGFKLKNFLNSLSNDMIPRIAFSNIVNANPEGILLKPKEKKQ